MPIPTKSDAWESGEKVERIHHHILQFLKENPESAFIEREIADEVVGTRWEDTHETERLRQELTEEEYEERLHSDQLPDSDVPFGLNQHQMARLYAPLSKLADMELIEAKEVDADGFDLPYDWEEVIAFSYAGPE